MYRVRLVNEDLREVERPEMVDFSQQSIGSRDVLICCAGFEDRSLRALDIASIKSGAGFVCILINYHPLSEDNRHDDFIRLLSRANVKVVELDYDRRHPAGFGKVVSDALHRGCGDVFIDISGMSRFLIVQLLVALGRDRRLLHRMSVIYTEALRYYPSQGECQEIMNQDNGDNMLYKSFFLSSGVIDLMLIPELSSIALQGQPVRLVAFPSFNVDQLAALRGEVQPSFLCLLNGIPPRAENSWRPEAISTLNQVGRIVGHAEFDVSTFDYRETLDLLVKIYESHGRYEKLIISPTGSKLQTVAVGIFKIFMTDVQVVYPVPKTFDDPERYTGGSRSTFLLPLKAFAELLR